MKKTLCFVILTLCIGYLSAQSNRTVPTEVCRGEHFILDTDYNNHEHHMNYEFYASDSIVLNPGFSRANWIGGDRCTMDLSIDELGVYPPSHGLLGGPNVGDSAYVGSLGGIIDVGAMGGAVYTIPIEVPKGINGMQPELSLVYNSQGGNGLVGWKWDLAGLSSITRTGQTRYHDGAVGGVTLNDITDRFLLDGQRLIQVYNYGDSIEYKTEQDGMARIRAYVQEVSYSYSGTTITYPYIVNFKVWNSDGTILEYGFTEDSRISAQNDDYKAVCWLVSKKSDRNGNAILFTYNTNQQTGEYYISQIYYTYNDALGIKPEFVVDFVYPNTGRLDYDFKYIGGNIIQQKRYLEQIRISRTTESEPLEQYSFEYGDNGHYQSYDSVQMHHRLEKIYYEKARMALNPTTIRWSSYGDNNVMKHWEISDTAIYNNFPFVGDFNADGYSDLVVVPFKGDTIYYSHSIDPRFFLNNQSANFDIADIDIEALPNTLDWIYVLDIDDDGYEDIVTVCYDSLSNKEQTDVMVYKNTRSQGSIAFVPVWEKPLCFNNKIKIAIGDFLGEGKRSLLVFAVNGVGNAVTRAVYVPCDGGWCFTHHVDFETGATMPAFQIEPGEYLGDGHTELFVMGANDSGIWKLEEVNSTFILRKKTTVNGILFSNENARSQVFAGDYNGDGITDLLSYHQTGGNSKGQNIWTMYFSMGNGFVSYGTAHNLNCQMPKHELYGNSLRKIQLAEIGTWCSVCASDFDGDGATDVAVVRNNGHYSSLDIYFKYRKDSNRFLTVFQGSYYYGQHHNDYPINCRTQYMHVGNFMGKENCSFLGLRKVTDNPAPQHNTTPRLYNLKSAADLNSVDTITDGMGNITKLEYGIVLQPYQNYGYGVRQQTIPIMVLKASTTISAVGKPVVNSYGFSGPCFHRDGHGFLGFKQTTIMTSNNNYYLNKVIKDYSLDVMQNHALLLPSQEKTYVYPTNNNNPVISSMTRYTFKNVTNTMNSLVTCPALTKKEIWNYNVDEPSAGMLSKTIMVYDYNYTSNGIGQTASYTHDYNCIETNTGINGTEVNEVAVCEFRTREVSSYDIIYPNDWILGRLTSQVTTQSMTGKEDKVNTVLLSYNSNNNYQVCRETDIPNTEQSNDRLTVKTEFSYYPTGALRSKTLSAPYGNQNESQRTTTYEYGDGNFGRLMTKETVTVGGLEYETNYSYDEYDHLDTLVDKNGLVTIYVTDPLGITSLVKNPDGTVIGEAYRWAAGQPHAPDSASYYSWNRSSGLGKQLTFYNKSGEVLKTVTFGPKSQPIISDIQYNDRGLTHSVSNPYFEGDSIYWTKYGYDRMERLTTMTTPDETTTEIIRQGLVTRTHISDINGNEQKTKRTDNIRGWMVSNRDPQYITVNYDYYADGSLASTQVGSNIASRISIGYDSRGNRNNLTDPDYGTSTFLFDAYGNLKQRTSPKSDVTSYQYDPMGRLVQKYVSGENQTTTFVYDETEGLKGTLKSITHGSQTIQYQYDQYLRPVKISETLFGSTYETQLAYDRASRISQVTYPTGVIVKNDYSVYGHLIAVKDVGNHTLWEAGETNAMGQLLQSTMGGDIVTDRQFDSKMHYIKGIATSNNLQNLSYGYDKFGNLARRTDSLCMMTETFGYDQLNRLTDIDFGSNHCQIQYDNYGRMVSKQALVWKYGGPHVQTVFAAPQFDEDKIHAMTEAVANPDWFDEDPLSINYTSFDKVSYAAIDNSEVSFQYGFNEERIRMSESNDTWERQKTYVANCEFITESNTDAVTVKSWTFLNCPTGVFAVVEKQGEDETLYYILKDHQDSWTVITDAVGEVEQELSYDAWGNMRDPETWCVDASMRPMFDRGYTGHEHLNGFGLINMNGRMYDPVMSSFLSVDRYVQQPDNSQGFNRYAYCMYNPLKYVDLSGWGMTLPEGLGVLPPPDGDEIDIFPTGVYTDTGFSSEYNSYTYNYGLSQVEVTPYGTWAEQRCKELVWEQNYGGLSAEYSGGEVNVPILSGGGGGGIFWNGGYNTPAKGNGLSSSILSYPSAAVSTLLEASSYSYLNNKKSLTDLGKNLTKAQKAKLAAKYPKELTKGASAAKYGKVVAKGIQKSGNALGWVGLAAEGLEIGLSGNIYASNVYNIVIGIICVTTGPVGLVIGGAALIGDIVSYSYNGRTIGGNIDSLFDDKSYKLWNRLY